MDFKSLKYSSENSEIIKETDSFESYDPQNESQEFAKQGLEELTKYMVEQGGIFIEPAIIGIQGKPGIGKSHLLNAIKLKLLKNNINFSHNTDKHFLQNKGYTESGIIIIDDLFQSLRRVEELDNIIVKVTLKYIEEMIFDLYEKNKILIISSNFNINDILKKLSKGDEIGRLKDRIYELLGHVQPIEIIGESYRKIKAKKESRISNIFEKVKQTVENTTS